MSFDLIGFMIGFGEETLVMALCCIPSLIVAYVVGLPPEQKGNDSEEGK